MRIPSKLLLAAVALATISACSSERSEEDQAALEARLTEENKLPETLAEIVSHQPDLTTMNAAVGLTGLPASPKAAEGPFTAFAPTNDAFNKLGFEASTELMKPEQKEKLTNILWYHNIKGAMTTDDMVKAIKDGGGTATFTTMQGGTLKASMDGDKIVLEDATGDKATVISDGIKSDKGLLYKVDTVLMPE